MKLFIPEIKILTRMFAALSFCFSITITFAWMDGTIIILSSTYNV